MGVAPVDGRRTLGSGRDGSRNETTSTRPCSHASHSSAMNSAGAAGSFMRGVDVGVCPPLRFPDSSSLSLPSARAPPLRTWPCSLPLLSAFASLWVEPAPSSPSSLLDMANKSALNYLQRPAVAQGGSGRPRPARGQGGWIGRQPMPTAQATESLPQSSLWNRSLVCGAVYAMVL